MTRVLEVLATLKRAGAETMAVSLACGLDRSRFEAGVVAMFDTSPDDLENKLRECGIRVWRLGKRPGLDLRIYGRLRRVMQDFRPDIVHTHSYVMRYTLPVTRCAAVHTVHNLASREVDRLGQLVHRLAFRRGVIPVAVAGEVAKSFHSLYGFPPQVIPNGIDLTPFGGIASRQEWRAAHGFTSEETLIVSIARLEPQKNPHMLVEAFHRLPASCQLLLVGDGSLRGSLTGIERVHLLGVRTDTAAILRAADVFALASDWEGHPIALMEALAAGLPLVATEVGGTREIVADAGLLIPSRDSAALTAALQSLIADRTARELLSRRARARADMFDVRNMVASYSELFESVVRK